MVIKVAHDPTCPWCWIALFQVKALESEFDVQFDWIGYELWPAELGWPEARTPEPVNADRPKVASRLELAYAAQGMEPPTAERPKRMRIHNALEAMEYAKTEGVAEALVERLYNAFWLEGREIADAGVIAELAEGIVKNIPAMLKTIEERRFADKIV